MKISRRMEWPYIDEFESLEDVSSYCQLLYQTLTEESALRAIELDVPYTDGYNVFLGHEAGISNTISLDDTEGVYNVFIGHQAGYSNTTGIKNIGIGYKPLYTNTTGGENTALGSEALYSNTTGANNVALGNDALYTNATGNYNVAVGFEALKVSTASNNVAVGYQALVANTSGANNIALGYQTLDANSTGAGNVAIGESALTANTTASFNLAIGYNALTSNTDGHTNIAIGHSALTGNTSADYNIAIGYQALDASNTGDKNIAIGFGCLGTNTSGYENVAIGYEALKVNVGGYYNVAIGVGCGIGMTSGDSNVAIGYQSLYTNTISDNNVAIGHKALYSHLDSAGSNVAIGWLAGEDTTGGSNVMVGAVAGQNVLGAENTLIGSGAGQGGNGSTATKNVCVGTDAGGSLTTGEKNVFIGYQCAYTRETTGSNKLYIANSNTATPLIYGKFDNGFLAINDNANTKMTAGLTINQGAYDNEILAFKSSDIAHGCTVRAETDTFGYFKKVSATGGGLDITGFGEGQYGLYFIGATGTDNTDKDATAHATIILDTYTISGTNWGAKGADANILAVKAVGGTRFIVDEDGDVLYDGTAGAYQDHDDIELLAELEVNLDKSNKLKSNNKYKKKDLEDAKLLRPFLSTKRLNMLQMGAIRQLNEKIEALEARLDE